MNILEEDISESGFIQHPHNFYCSQQQQQQQQEEELYSASGPNYSSHTTASSHTSCHCQHVHLSTVRDTSSITSEESLFATSFKQHASCQKGCEDYVLNDNMKRICRSPCQRIMRDSRCLEPSTNVNTGGQWSLNNVSPENTRNSVKICGNSQLDYSNKSEFKKHQCTSCSGTMICRCDSARSETFKGILTSQTEQYLCSKSTNRDGAQSNYCCDKMRKSFMEIQRVSDNESGTFIKDLQTHSMGSKCGERTQMANHACPYLLKTQDFSTGRELASTSKALSLCERTHLFNLGEHMDGSLISRPQICNEKHLDKSYEKEQFSINNSENRKVYGTPGAYPLIPERQCCTTASRWAPGTSKNILLMLQWIALIFSVEALAVQGQSLGPRYRTSRRMCVSDDECNRAIGEVCWWAWDGCDTGECMCDPRISFHDTSMHFCRPLKFGDERCESGDKCWEGMACIGGYCKCKQGRMTSDRMFCQKGFQRLLGQTCSAYSDVCYQRAVHGYIIKETNCGVEGVCKCNSGYKTDGKACRKWEVNEPGCSEDHHCEGGALCIDNICQCPSTYHAVAGSSKCAKYGARYDLHLGEVCNEDDEKGYCASGLICHRCPSESEYKCVRFVEAEALPYHFAGSNRKTFSVIYILLAALSAAVYMCTFCFR